MSFSLAFGRGNAAFVAINNQASAWKTTFKSGLVAGNCESSTRSAPISSTLKADPPHHARLQRRRQR